MKTEDILNEREKTHGSFSMVSSLSQRLKSAVSDVVDTSDFDDLGDLEYEDGLYVYENKINHKQKEALDSICGKIARIVCGDPNYADHWDDIAGYAMLGKGEVKGKLMKGSGGIRISEHVGSELLFDDAGELLLDDVGEVKEKGKVLPDYVEEEEKNRVCCVCDNDIVEVHCVFGSTGAVCHNIKCFDMLTGRC